MHQFIIIIFANIMTHTEHDEFVCLNLTACVCVCIKRSWESVELKKIDQLYWALHKLL